MIISKSDLLLQSLKTSSLRGNICLRWSRDMSGCVCLECSLPPLARWNLWRPRTCKATVRSEKKPAGSGRCRSADSGDRSKSGRTCGKISSAGIVSDDKRMVTWFSEPLRGNRNPGVKKWRPNGRHFCRMHIMHLPSQSILLTSSEARCSCSHRKTGRCRLFCVRRRCT